MDITTSQPKSCQGNFSEAPQTSLESSKLTQTYSPSEKYLVEWCEGSGVSEAITRLAVKYLKDRKVIAHRIGWKNYPDEYPLGWWCSGLDLITMKPQAFGQFKPDIAIQFPEKEKPTKYISDKQHPYDAIALPHPDKDFWQRVVDDVSIPTASTEGTKKSGDLMTCGYAALSVCGVAMWQRKGELVSNLKAVAVPGRTHTIVYDMDLLTKKEVLNEVKKKAKALIKEGVNVLIAMWNPELGLKIDDVKVKHGPEMVHKIMSEAQPYPQWLKSLEAQIKEPAATEEGEKKKKKKKKKLPPPSVVAGELAEIYREKLAWESEYQLWRHYGANHDGLWDIETNETVRGLIHSHLRCKDLPGFNAGYVSSIATILQSDLEVTDWNEQTGLIPLRDGVLNQLNQELKPHKPGYRFTWQLPFKWADRAIGCKPIEEFLLKITGNQDIADVLLAYLSAIVTRRSDLQRYLELKGGGGTGKSTYMAVARALTGDDNTVSSQLKHLENNQFETAKFYGKILALFPDSERWQGEVSVLKQLTGQDPVRYERKGVQQCRDFIYRGMVILSANEAPESRDLTSGQERRKLTIELDIKVPEYEDAELPEQFKPYLPGLLKRVLDIPAAEVRRLIKHTDREVPALARVKWKQLCETNPIAGWLEEKAIIKPDAKGYIGLGDIDQAGRWLYANFCKYQQDNGHKNSVSMKRFSLNLRDLLKNQMKVAITEGRDRDGSYLYGVGLRCQLDPAGELYPCPVTKKPFCDGFVMDCDGSVTVETFTDVGFDGYAGFSQNSNDTENSQNKISVELPKNQFCEVDGGKNPPNPPNPTPASVPTVTNPSQRTENPSHPPTPAPPEPETAPTPPPAAPLEPEPDAELVKQGVEALRKAIAESDAVAVREAATMSIKLDSTGRLKAAIKELLTPEQNEACRTLANSNRKQPTNNSSQTAPVAEPIALPENSQSPELAEPAPELLAPSPLAREFAQRIREAIGYQSPAVATAIKRDLDRSIEAGDITAADVLAVVGAVELAEFDRLVGDRV